jgi:hypothetical protein
LLLTIALICAVVSSGTFTVRNIDVVRNSDGSLMAMTRTLGVPLPQSGALPPTGGLPEKSLTLKGKLVHEGGPYKLDVNALPGYVVTLRFTSSELETWAAAHVGGYVAVSGYWDEAQPSIFLVESATLP